MPDDLIERHKLQRRITSRGGAQELRFLACDGHCLLPAWVSNRLMVLPWGNQSKRIRLPQATTLSLESLESGKYQWMKPGKVTIPAAAGTENGRWYQIEQGVAGVVVRDQYKTLHVYMLLKRASHYYRIMTGSDRMPVLVNQEL